MISRFFLLVLFFGGIYPTLGLSDSQDKKVDLSGFYDSGTLTPLSRPQQFGDKQFMTRQEADEITRNMRGLLATSNSKSDPNRSAPKLGGDGNNSLGAGGVGGYNAFWVDPGSDVYEIDGKIRTSIIYDPPNGRQPPMTAKGRQKMARNFASFAYNNDGTASWLSKQGPGPFDGPETLALAERCLLGFSAGPPSLPGLYNNFKRIIQTDDHVMILLEMVHDARVIKLNAEHSSSANRQWLGDSVGRWEGDTLVVETINFKPAPDCTVGMKIFTLWSGSVCWKMATCYIDLPSLTQPFGPSLGVVNTFGRRAPGKYMNTLATKVITPWAIY